MNFRFYKFQHGNSPFKICILIYLGSVIRWHSMPRVTDTRRSPPLRQHPGSRWRDRQPLSSCDGPDAVMLAGWSHRHLVDERTTAFRNCDRGMTWRVTAIIPAVEMAWRQVVHLFF